MLFLLMLTAFVACTCAYTIWLIVQDTSPDPEARPAHEQIGPAAAGSRPEPGSLEGVLVAQLVAAAITRRQYVREMERVAARDDERHPLAIPPEIGSDGS
ncbi:hypothetical protein ACIBSW_35600 [Actinoplanes sp. NPDC049668]|uniref:hypothetical protein n=1 Tax=unclassified Actinoplanes TaxID=2626549 RepID=UPI0033AA48DE